MDNFAVKRGGIYEYLQTILTTNAKINFRAIMEQGFPGDNIANVELGKVCRVYKRDKRRGREKRECHG